MATLQLRYGFVYYERREYNVSAAMAAVSVRERINVSVVLRTP